MTKLKIKVTKEILKNSAFCDGRRVTNCAVALAVREIWPDAKVSGLHIFPFISSEKIRLPFKVSMYIANFDLCTAKQRMNLPEIEFEVEVPDSVINKINIKEIKQILKTSSTLELV